MKIKVLGTGCKTCKTLHENVVSAIEELSLTVDVEYITDVEKIIAMGFMKSPILIVEGKNPIVGQMLSTGEIKELLQK